MTIPEHLLKLGEPDPTHFIDTFFAIRNEHLKDLDAYEAVERIHEATFGRRRYSCYNSFRNVRDKQYKSATKLHKSQK